jgi:GTPase SAR1 family protein
MRVMITGPGDAGKTTLVHRLLTEEFSPRQFSMTDGVSMREWRPTATGDPLSHLSLFGSQLIIDTGLTAHLSLWDFGGQEVYLHTHPMLFSDKTLYLLVWNPRAGTSVSLLEEYLLNIRSRAPSSRVILVTTHADEVDQNEGRKWVDGLQKHNCESYQAVDSCSGTGIEELKQSIVEYVTKEAVAQSRVLVPRWYSTVETKLKEMSKKCASRAASESKMHFSIGREEFAKICDSCLPHSVPSSNANFSSGQKVQTILDLFHDWGVVFVLPSDGGLSGDIVLDPQDLADVFKSVITCRAASTSALENRTLFEEGILSHNQLEFLWPRYEAHLRPQFLSLLHDCELAYEIFDRTGQSTGRSLVPALLPDVSKLGFGLGLGSRLKERELREHLLADHPPDVPASVASDPRTRAMITRGFVRLRFDCLLPNFFPKLILRLRHITSQSLLSRSSFVAEVIDWDDDGVDRELRSSLVFVVEDREIHTLTLYPCGSSFKATSICAQVIRRLMDVSFAGMCLEELSFSAEDEVFSHNKILSHLRAKKPVTVPLPIENNTRDKNIDHGLIDRKGHLEISLAFLSCLFVEMDGRVTLSASLSSLSQSLSSDHVQTLSMIQSRLALYDQSKRDDDRLMLSQSLIEAIPIFRQSGLSLDPLPKILWLVGKCSSTSTLHMFGVSPSVRPGWPWEVVWESEVSFPASATGPSEVPCALSELLLKCLALLLPNNRLPTRLGGLVSNSALDWIGLVDCGSYQQLIASQESRWFVQDRDFFGVCVEYSRDFLMRQRGQASADEMRAIMREEVQGAVGDVVVVLDAIVSSHVAPLREDLRGLQNSMEGLTRGLKEVRGSLLGSGDEAGWVQLQELWANRMTGLEALVLSTSCDEASIVKEMKKMEAALTAKLIDLDLGPERVVGEVSKLREEIVSINQARVAGKGEAEEKLKKLFEEVKAVRSQLDRVESTVAALSTSLRLSFDEVRVSLQSLNNEEGITELKEMWTKRMVSLEALVRSTTCDEATIIKEIKKIEAVLTSKLLDLDLGPERVVGELSKLREEIVSMRQMADGEALLSELFEELKRAVRA